jgi:RNA polymerase sigma factor (sigma-70 family)
MQATGLNHVVTRLLRSVRHADEAEYPDGELLDRFVKTRDEHAFQVLMRRHGPMVLGVCRRLLRNQADAEDAFQATFLVLVRKAGSISPRALVGNWLYGVAYKAALKALAMNRTRLVKEREALARKGQPANDAAQLHELLDAELSALPDVFRTPIVLCELEGRTIKEAAEHLGWPPGTVASRLARGRRRLAERLTRLGYAVPAAGLTALLAESVAAASIPSGLQAATVHAALSAVGSEAAAANLVSAKAALITEQTMQALLLQKLKALTVATALTTALCLAAGLLLSSAHGQQAAENNVQAAAPAPAGANQANPDSKKTTMPKADARKLIETLDWALTEVDAGRSIISVSDHIKPPGPGTIGLFENRTGIVLVTTPGGSAAAGLAMRGLHVAKDAKITLDGKAVQLDDLKTSSLRVRLRLREGGAVVAGIEAMSPRPPVFSYVLKAVDAKRRTITAALAENQLELNDVPVSANAKIQRLRIEPALSLGSLTLADLEPGMVLALELTAGDDGQLRVTSILATRQKPAAPR